MSGYLSARSLLQMRGVCKGFYTLFTGNNTVADRLAGFVDVLNRQVLWLTPDAQDQEF